jgi:hypothetical protein
MYDISNLMARMCDEAAGSIRRIMPRLLPDERPRVEATRADLRGLSFDTLGTQVENGFAPYDPILSFVPNFFADFDVISGTFQERSGGNDHF